MLLNGNDAVTGTVGEYSSMDECFANRDKIVEQMGRPIMNYQAICIIKVDTVDL
jgi:hypothetical protein